MDSFLLQDEAAIYSLVYFGSIIVVAIWEEIAPRRRLSASTRTRWFSHFFIAVINTGIIRGLFPFTVVPLAITVTDRGWGLLQNVNIRFELTVLISIIALDLTRFVQHIMLHKLSLLWRCHRIHHSDPDYDFSTGFRFHPLEAGFTTSMSCIAVVALGAPVLAVIVSEILFVLSAVVVHGNVRYSRRIDGFLRLFVVTPDMHRIHHSARTPETDSNFGAAFSVWDRLFGTYTSQPVESQETMTIGLDGYNDPEILMLPRIMVDPFLRGPDANNSNAREVIP